MARLDLRLDKANMGNDMRLGIVARVRQVRDASGGYPDEPLEREVVIPAGISQTRTVDGLPFGTYRIEARLPSGQVLRETRELSPGRETASAVFNAGGSPHEWLALQRLAGNVPSEAEYEQWLGKLADQVNDFAKAKLTAAKPFEVDPATLGRLARLLRSAHLKVEPYLKSMASRFGGSSVDLKTTIDDGLAKGITIEPAPAQAPHPAEFEIVQALPLPGEPTWEAMASMPAWTAWRAAAQTDVTVGVERVDDRQLTLWRLIQNDRTRRVLGPAGRQMPMRSFVAMRRGEGVDVMPLPVPWPMQSFMPPAAIEILRESGVTDAGRTALTVRDDFVGSLILYLGNGQMADAATVLAEVNRENLIEDLISDKLDNPFAACAAAYVGIATVAATATPPRWTFALDNLMNLFDWLPDGAIIRGSHLLKTAKSRPDLDQALASFKMGFRRGIPFYTVGVQQLLNGLYTFSEEDAEARAMHGKVSAVASRVDGSQAFTQIMIAPSAT